MMLPRLSPRGGQKNSALTPGKTRLYHPVQFSFAPLQFSFAPFFAPDLALKILPGEVSERGAARRVRVVVASPCVCG
jgi:hypothetical protein